MIEKTKEKEQVESDNENQQAVATVVEAETTVTEAAPAETAPAAPLSLAEQLAAARAEAARNLDGWQRAQAEFANARKRLEKQRAETYINATADVAAKLLPVLDDFDRALSNVPATINQDSWFEGVQLVERKLALILDGLNVKPIEAVGQPFDPNCHEAIMQEASDEFESGAVTRELQKGYKIGERVIRPALVYVAE